MNLYQLSQEYLDASHKLQDLELDDQTIADTLEGMAGEIEVKAQNVAFVIRNLESLAEQIKTAEAEMAKRRKSLENRASRVREYLLSNMLATKITKIECPYFTVSPRSNPPSVVVDAEGQIPQEYFKLIPESWQLDKNAVKQAIKEGKEVPGVHLESSVRLEIK